MSSKIFAVLVNGIAQLEFDRQKPLPALQQQFLDKMDREFDAGISLNGQFYRQPDQQIRARFVALNLVNSLRGGNEQVAAAMCAYLATRLPELKQVKATDSDEGVAIDLVFDEEYVKQVAVDFTRPAVKPTKH